MKTMTTSPISPEAFKLCETELSITASNFKNQHQKVPQPTTVKQNIILGVKSILYLNTFHSTVRFFLSAASNHRTPTMNFNK